MISYWTSFAFSGFCLFLFIPFYLLYFYKLPTKVSTRFLIVEKLHSKEKSILQKLSLHLSPTLPLHNFLFDGFFVSSVLCLFALSLESARNKIFIEHFQSVCWLNPSIKHTRADNVSAVCQPYEAVTYFCFTRDFLVLKICMPFSVFVTVLSVSFLAEPLSLQILSTSIDL